MTLLKYIAKEIFSIFGLTSAILLLIVLSNQFSRYLTLAASGKMLGLQLVHLILLEIPQLLSLIFPLALYLGILLAYGRLYTDSEMIVLNASGFSQKQLLKMTLLLASIVAVPVFLFTVWLNPVVADDRNKLLAQISATSVVKTLMPGRFQSASGGNEIFYIESMSDDRKVLNNIFIAQHKDNNSDSWTVMHANSGYYSYDPHTREHFAVAQQGKRYEGVPGENNFTVSEFDQYGLQLNTPVMYVKHSEIDSVPTLNLLQHTKDAKKHLNNMAELQWRLSLPLCVFILSFLALSISYVSPRAGRFSKMFPAVLIYIIYANFMIAGQDWVSNGQIPPWLGLWGVHFMMIVLGACLYAQRENLFQKFWKTIWKA